MSWFRRTPELPPSKPACEHDWRKDPEGWKEAPPLVVVEICALCGDSRYQWRKNTDVIKNWPKADGS